jgi:acetoin utilization protein AcuB
MKLIQGHHIRRLPVVDGDTLVGIVSERDLLRAMPSPATSLSVWEIPELLNRLLVREVMTRHVVVVHAETPIQEAAQLMVDHKIGGLPVVDDGRVVGVITETDIFRVFVGLCGGIVEDVAPKVPAASD